MTDNRADLRLTCGQCGVDGSLVIDIRVQARSSRLTVGTVENSRLKLRLTAPPVDGKANQQAIKLLAKSFGVAPSHVKLIRGRTSRDKSFRITDATKIPPVVFADNDNHDSDET